MRDAGAEVVPVSVPWTPDNVMAWWRWWNVYLAAAFSHLLPEHRDALDPDVAAILEAGLAMDAVSFARIDQTRTVMWHQLCAIFENHHALLCPTMAQPAPLNSTRDADFEEVDAHGRLHGLDMTAVFNMVGQCPALSVPSGVTSTGLPTAAQIVTPRFNDPLALRIGAAIEARRPWAAWTPDRLG